MCSLFVFVCLFMSTVDVYESVSVSRPREGVCKCVHVWVGLCVYIGEWE